MIGLGIMSGSSLDGLDLAMVSFGVHNKDWQLIDSIQVDLSDTVGASLKKLAPTSTYQDYVAAELLFTDFVYEVIETFLNKKKQLPEYIAIHGHTLLHSQELGHSCQMINAGRLAALIGIDVVSDFRNQDLALGGIGTPMAVIADRDLFAGYDYYINLGGIANMSHQQSGHWHAFDVFPFNQVLNYCAGKLGYAFDRDGQLAAQGQIDTELLNKLLSHPFTQKKVPKYIDNSWIHTVWIPMIERFGLSSEDTLSTYVEYCCQTLLEYISDDNARILLTGGGAFNTYFIERLRTVSAGKHKMITPVDSVIEYKEAILMAYMGYLRLRQENNFISQATGAQYDVCAGAVYKGKSKL